MRFGNGVTFDGTNHEFPGDKAGRGKILDSKAKFEKEQPNRVFPWMLSHFSAHLRIIKKNV